MRRISPHSKSSAFNSIDLPSAVRAKGGICGTTRVDEMNRMNSEWSTSMDVRFGAHSGLKSDITVLPKSADSVAKLPKCRATNFPRKDEPSDNHRSMQPQTRYRNRLWVWRTMAWFPTQLFDRRAYGSENSSAVPQKDFCNTICQ
jgi:hypothetical protein